MSHWCMGWCWKWQWRARRRLWLQPTLNWRRSCLTRRPGFPSGTVQSDLRESCTAGLLPAGGATTLRERINARISQTVWQIHLSRGTVHCHLCLFIRCNLTSLQSWICWQCVGYLDEVTRLSKRLSKGDCLLCQTSFTFTFIFKC